MKRYLLCATAVLLVCQASFAQEYYNPSHNKRNRSGHRWSISVGADFASMRGTDSNGTLKSFPSTVRLRAGFAGEITFHSSSSRTVLVLETIYQSYKVDRPFPLRYSSIEIPVGVRRYLGKSNRGPFVNALVVADLPFSFQMDLGQNLIFNATGLAVNFGLGGGFSTGRWSAEFRYHTPRNRKDDTSSFDFNYRKSSFILGYRFL